MNDPDPRRRKELSLDPEDWTRFGALAHRALDDAIESMRTLAQRPPWQPFPEADGRAIRGSLPEQPLPLDQVYEQYRRHIAPYPTGNGHPRFWGWVMGNGTAEGMLADLLASSMNPHLAGYDQSAAAVEESVIDWLRTIMGYPSGASGILVSGGTAANMTGLAVARHAMADFDVREDGLSAGPPLRVYGSTETHSWVEKSCDLLGMGRRSFVRVAADADGRVEIEALRRAIRHDRDLGLRPFCSIANAGTVDMGAIDDLDAMADLAAEEGLWLHVDGAFGALLAFSERLRPRLRGLERADSMAFDLHKWGYLQYELGCVLVKDAEAHRATFATTASYLDPPGRGIQPTSLSFPELGLQLSRGFRALKVWFSLRHHGIRRIGRVIEQNVEQGRYLAERIEREPELELLAPVPLNVVCFRYIGPPSPKSPPSRRNEEHLETLNREILLRIQEEGIAVPSSTRRSGRFALRVAITNHRSTLADFDLFLDAVLRFGREQIRSDSHLDVPPSRRTHDPSQ